jgi:PHD/YefM family antitoxin component YafN of YafNO toxin-antitoxin module
MVGCYVDAHEEPVSNNW